MFKHSFFIMAMMITQQLSSINQNIQQFKRIAKNLYENKENWTSTQFDTALTDILTTCRAINNDLKNPLNKSIFESPNINEIIKIFSKENIRKIFEQMKSIHGNLIQTEDSPDLKEKGIQSAKEFKRNLYSIRNRIVQWLIEQSLLSNIQSDATDENKNNNHYNKIYEKNYLISMQQLSIWNVIKKILIIYKKRNPIYNLFLVNHHQHGERKKLEKEIFNLLFHTEQKKNKID